MPLDLPPPVAVLEVTVASRGMSKGLAQTEGAQVVVRPEATFGRLRVAAYAKNVTSVEFDGEAGLVVGYKWQSGKTEVAASIGGKRLLDAAAGVDTSALELNASLARSWGKIKPKVSLTYSPDELGGSGRSYFWEMGSSYQLDKKVGLQAGIGIRSRAGGPDYTSLTAAVTRNLGHRFTAELRLYHTNRDELGIAYRRRLVVLLRARV